MVDSRSKRNKKDRGNIENTIEGKWLKQKIDFHLPGNFKDDSIILAQPVFDRLRSILICFIYFQALLFWLLLYIIYQSKRNKCRAINF